MNEICPDCGNPLAWDGDIVRCSVCGHVEAPEPIEPEEPDAE